MGLQSAALANPDLGGLTSLLGASPEGAWTRVNLNRFADAWLPYEQRAQLGFAAESSSVIGAWSSFAWDSKRGDLIIYGGGHANYAGNEVYRWSGVTRAWSLASRPSQVAPWVDGSGYAHYLPVDGPLNAPQSAHTYDNTLYLPVADRYVSFGGAATNGGGLYVKPTGGAGWEATGPYFWDPAKADAGKVGGSSGSGIDPATPGGQMWQNRDYMAVSNLAGASSRPGAFIQGASDYRNEAGTDVVYITAMRGSSSTHDLWRVSFADVDDPTQDRWDLVGQGWDGGFALGSGALDAAQNVFVRVGAGDALTVWDLEDAGPYNRSLSIGVSFEGGAAVDLTGAGLVYDPRRDQFMLWKGGEAVWYLDVPQRDLQGELVTTGWVFRQAASAAGATPGDVVEGGVNGKWVYLPELDAFMALENKVDGNVWLYKPSDWAPALPVPEPGIWALLLGGLAGLGLHRRAARRAHDFTG